MSFLKSPILRGCVLVAIALGSAGCSVLQSPFDNLRSFRRGERPSYTIEQMTNENSPSCKDTEINCFVIGKLVLNKPSDNLSFQILRRNTDQNGKIISVDAVTCASPAEAGKTISNEGAASTALPIKVAGAAASSAAAASSSTTETLVILKSIDPASQYVATASFANCLAFAGGMYDARKAAEMQKQIFDNAVPISGAASASKK